MAKVPISKIDELIYEDELEGKELEKTLRKNNKKEKKEKYLKKVQKSIFDID